jgi:translation initiation factor 4G
MNKGGSSEDLKELFAVRNLDEAEVFFSGLPPQHHHFLVDKIVLNPKKMTRPSF